MKKFSKEWLVERIKNPSKIMLGILRRTRWLWSDETYIKLKWYFKFHKKLDLANPQTFNEKLQWLKLYDRRPEYTRMVDKYAAKQYVAEVLGGGQSHHTYSRRVGQVRRYRL